MYESIERAMWSGCDTLIINCLSLCSILSAYCYQSDKMSCYYKFDWTLYNSSPDSIEMT